MAKKTRRSARKATNSRKAKRARRDAVEEACRSQASGKCPKSSRPAKDGPDKDAKASKLSGRPRPSGVPSARRGGTGREETLAQTPETGRPPPRAHQSDAHQAVDGHPLRGRHHPPGARSRASSASAARGRRDRAQPSLEPGPEPADTLGSAIRATGAPRIAARASRNQSRTDGRATSTPTGKMPIQ